MSLALLDTTFLIDAERDQTALDAVLGDEDDVAVAAITVAELLVGVELASPRHREQRKAFVEDLVGSLPVIPYDLSIAQEHARLLAAVKRAGRPRGAHDLMIAATARATQRVVITADPGAFDGLPGVEVRSLRAGRNST
ncbi:MAG: PIN domain-containing protein [Actinobacteria bacterium]|nr:PIN domain-containing protein [Actinomycetota bacterium]